MQLHRSGTKLQEKKSALFTREPGSDLHCTPICPYAVQQGLLHPKEHVLVPVLGLEEITQGKNGTISFLYFKSALNY